MLSMKDMIKRIRSRTHDVEEIGWTDDEVIEVINAGYRFLARMIKADKPELLAEEPFIGTLEPKNNTIKLPKMADVIIGVIVNGQHLKPISQVCMSYADDYGPEAKGYYLRGFDKLIVWPTPSKETKFQVDYVADCSQEFEELEDISPLPTDFDDLIIEYATIRLSMANEFEMSQETTLMEAIVNQIEELLRNYDTGINHHVQSYWAGIDGSPDGNVHIYSNDY